MHKAKFVYLILGLVFLGVFSAQAANGKSQFVICERKAEVRWIRIFSSADGKCKTVYSKEGYSQIVSSATYYSSCESVLQNIKKNVELGGYKCREEQLAQIIEIE